MEVEAGFGQGHVLEHRDMQRQAAKAKPTGPRKRSLSAAACIVKLISCLGCC